MESRCVNLLLILRSCTRAFMTFHIGSIVSCSVDTARFGYRFLAMFWSCSPISYFVLIGLVKLILIRVWCYTLFVVRIFVCGGALFRARSVGSVLER